MKINWKLLIVFILALVIRLIFLGFHSVIEEDGVGLVTIGKNLVTGNGYIGIEGDVDLVYSPLYPLLVGLLSFIVRNLELAGRLISVLFGGLLVIPIYLIAKKVYNKKVALIAGLLTALYPVLVYLSDIVYAESLYFFVFFFGIYFALESLDNKKWLNYVLTGLLFGVGYWIKPEIAIAVLIFFVFSLVKNKKEVIVKSLVFLLIFLVVIAPYIGFLYLETGKLLSNGKSSLTFLLSKGDVGSEEYEKTFFELENEKLKRDILRKEYRNIFSYVFSDGFFKNYFKNLWEEIFKVRSIFPLVFLLISFLGLKNFRWENKFLFLLFLYPLLFFPMFVIWVRYLSLIVPFLLIWMSKGVFEFGKYWKLIIGVLVVVLLIGNVLALYSGEGDIRTEAIEHKEMGEWLKNNGYEGKIIMGRKAWVAYYSEGKQVYLPYANYDETKKYGCLNDVDLIVIDERFIKTRPMLKDLLNNDDYLYKIDEPKKILVFELQC